MSDQDDIRALFSRAGVGQDESSIHLTFETEEEADEAFAYICELGSDAEAGGAMIKSTTFDWLMCCVVAFVIGFMVAVGVLR